MITLPIPPSVNEMFGKAHINSKFGKNLSKAYKVWRTDVDKLFMAKRFPVVIRPYGVEIRVNVNRNSDIDNRIKAVLDALERNKVICGDQWVDQLQVFRDPFVEGCVVRWWHVPE